MSNTAKLTVSGHVYRLNVKKFSIPVGSVPSAYQPKGGGEGMSSLAASHAWAPSHACHACPQPCLPPAMHAPSHMCHPTMHTTFPSHTCRLPLPRMPLPCEQNETLFSKHYLSATSFTGRN